MKEDQKHQTEGRLCTNLRSSEHTDGGDSVEVVAAHQVGDVVLELHLLTGEAGSLKQLSSGSVVVLRIRKTQSYCVRVCFWISCLIQFKENKSFL